MKKVIINPYRHVNFETTQKYKSNLHAHCYIHSDAKAHEVIDLYHQFGYKILSLTDHDAASGPRGTHIGKTTWPWNRLASIPTVNNHVLENRNPHTLGMLAVEGLEFTFMEHCNSLCNDAWGSTDLYLEHRDDVSRSIKEALNRMGIAMWVHPGRYFEGDYVNGEWQGDGGYHTQQMIDTFRKFASLVGTEIHSSGMYRAHRNKIMVDHVLQELMPFRPVWLYSNDDGHGYFSVPGRGHGQCYNVHFMEDLSMEAFARSLFRGESYAVLDIAGHKNIDRHMDNGTPIIAAPNIIDVSVTEGNITIAATNCETIKWISDGVVVFEGASLPLNTEGLGSYVRAVLEGEALTDYDPVGANPGGEGFGQSEPGDPWPPTSYSQPFGLVDQDFEGDVNIIENPNFEINVTENIIRRFRKSFIIHQKD